MKKDLKIIFCAQDAGSFNCICPVFDKIKAEKVFLLSGTSKKLAQAKKLDFTDAEELGDADLENFLKRFSPNVVVCGTGFGMNLEKKATAWARKNSKKVLSVVDFWSNYKSRFSTPDTEDLIYLPDKICIIDEFMREQMSAEGFKDSQLAITGNPFFDNFKKLAEGGKFTIFAEQPYAEIYEKPQFDEVKIFSEIVDIFGKYYPKKEIMIAFHPRSKNKSKFENIIKNSKLKISILNKPFEEILSEAEAVLGINSMALFEAALAGKKVLSYQPGIESNGDVLVSNRLHLSEAAYNLNSLEEKIEGLFSSGWVKNESVREKYLNNNSTQKVIGQIKELI